MGRRAPLTGHSYFCSWRETLPGRWAKWSICFLRNRGPGAERFGRSWDASFMLGCGGGGGRLRWRWSREQLPRSSTHGDICFSSQGYTGLAGSATQIVLTLRPCIQVPPPLMAQWWTHTHAHTSLFITHKIGQVAQCSSRHKRTCTPMPSEREVCRVTKTALHTPVATTPPFLC